MKNEPEDSKASEIFALEDLPQVGLDVGRPGEALVIAQQAQVFAIAADAPECALFSVKPVLQRRGGGTASIVREMGTRVVEIVRRRNNDDRDASTERFEADYVCPVAEDLGAGNSDVSESEYVAQKLLRESNRRLLRWMTAGEEFSEKRLADAEVARGLVAKSEPFGNVVVGIGLFASLTVAHFGEFGRRDEGAFERQGVE